MPTHVLSVTPAETCAPRRRSSEREQARGPTLEPWFRNRLSQSGGTPRRPPIRSAQNQACMRSPRPYACNAATMSRSYACNQFERNYKPVALCNWEVPADRVFTVKPTSTTPPKKTEFIVSDNGHLIGRGQHAQNAPIGSAPARLLWLLSVRPRGSRQLGASSCLTAARGSRLQSRPFRRVWPSRWEGPAAARVCCANG